MTDTPIDIQFTPKPRRPPSIILAKKGGGDKGAKVKGLFVGCSTFIEKKIDPKTNAVIETPKHRYVFSVMETTEKIAYVFGKKGEKPTEVPIKPHAEYSLTGRADLDRQMEDVRANPKMFVGVPFEIEYADYIPNRYGGHSHIFNVAWDDRYIGKSGPVDVVAEEPSGEEEA